MARIAFALPCALLLAATPTPTLAVAASSEMFPALKKRLEQQKLAAAQLHVANAQARAPDATETEEAPAKEAPAAVPSPMDAGADGYPRLPPVSEILSAASGTLKSVSAQASAFQARVVQTHISSESKLAKQKAVFEEKLKEQEKQNQQVVEANSRYEAETKRTEKDNAAIRKRASQAQKGNRLMRSELHTLQSRLGTAQDFTAKSLKSTDDSKSSLLQVLHDGRREGELAEASSKSKRGSDDSEEDDGDAGASDESEDDGGDDDGTSFLAVSRQVRRASPPAPGDAEAREAELAMPAADEPSTPGNLLEALSKDISSLAQQQLQSEQALKQNFIRDFQAGAKRRKALLTEQKRLVANLNSLQELQAKLKSAQAHLDVTHGHLEARLHGLGQYLHKLAHLAMAPPAEAPRLLELLPKAVAFKLEGPA